MDSEDEQVIKGKTATQKLGELRKRYAGVLKKEPKTSCDIMQLSNTSVNDLFENLRCLATMKVREKDVPVTQDHSELILTMIAGDSQSRRETFIAILSHHQDEVLARIANDLRLPNDGSEKSKYAAYQQYIGEKIVKSRMLMTDQYLTPKGLKVINLNYNVKTHEQLFSQISPTDEASLHKLILRVVSRRDLAKFIPGSELPPRYSVTTDRLFGVEHEDLERTAKLYGEYTEGTMPLRSRPVHQFKHVNSDQDGAKDYTNMLRVATLQAKSAFYRSEAMA